MYERAHIPGAVNVSPAELICGVPPATGKLPQLADLQFLFRRLGLTTQRKVVTYDDEGGGWAGRLAWTLDMIGHENWIYLDGGIHSWRAAGLPLSQEPMKPTPSQITIKVNSKSIARMQEVIRAIDDPEATIWDCRSKEEYEGTKAFAARAGHIPGAVNLDWLELIDDARDSKLIERLEEKLASHGITRDDDVITHCQTHHRSGLTYMAGRLLGFPRIRAYDGSWSEWGNHENTPVER